MCTCDNMQWLETPRTRTSRTQSCRVKREKTTLSDGSVNRRLSTEIVVEGLSFCDGETSVDTFDRLGEREDRERLTVCRSQSLCPCVRLNWPASTVFLPQHCFSLECESKPKRRSILRAYSLINILSPNKSKNTPRSSGSFKVPSVTPCKPALSPSPYRPPTPSPAKRRVSRTWTDSMAGDKHVHAMSRQVVKRQEAIYELYQGEKDISEDLINVRKMYRDSMMTLELCTSDEAYQIFGPLDQLIPVHQDLAKRLEQQRLRDGTTHGVGQQILDWVPRLRVYVSFCANQPFGKAMLNSKRNQPAFEDFLLRCQESPFSRKLDLWALLDGARGRFVKYPLLIKAILKETPVDHEDVALLHAAMTQLDDIIKQADNLTGQSECRFYKSQLVSLYDEQNIPEIEQSTVLICQGTLKNNKGTKLQLYLFDKVAVVTRNTSHGQNIYRQPIPVSLLVVEDLPDGEVRMGSFRSAFGQGQTSRNVFRISFTDPSLGQSHTLMANDEHNKQQWMRSFHSVTSHIIRVGAGNGDKK
ncbi:hypothetical protein V1264_019970 [Littorina saxatilis]|uniref:Rho guanine nucleotide exchange factor 3 n=1 Tax=Littorina saxatilis TaxID=31220 RepID=A0AAN9B967_9CAEN